MEPRARSASPLGSVAAQPFMTEDGVRGLPMLQEYKDRLRFSELQLDRERARCQSVQSNLDEVKTALSMCEAEMDRQAAERRVEAEQLLALRQQIKALNDDKQM